MIKSFFLPYWIIPLISCLFCVNIATAQDNGAVKKQISQLANSLENEKQQSDKLRSEIKAMEKKLGNITNNRFQTEKKIKAINHKLQASLKKKRLLQQEVKQQREALAQQLQALYSAGEQSHLRLLLRQDDPSEISRTIKYFEYFNTARVKKIQAAQTTLGKLKQVEVSIHEKQIKQKDWIKQLTKQTKEVKQLLAQRSRYLNKLKSKISSKEKRLERLLAQEAKLQTVIDQVAKKVITSAKAPPQTTKANPVKKVKGKQVTTHRVPNKTLTQLKGKLSWPIRGEMLHSYGEKRNGHQKWKAVVLAAAGGTKVKAIAKGEVIFAEWMEGYGHLVIIQHDKNYISLYGYNRSLYKKEGSRVKAGEVIAAVGNSGGQSRDALYFEIRKGRTPQNPSLWCK